MQVVQLDDEVEFDALSYVWGPQDETFSVICNGQIHHVHHNLHTALPYLANRHISSRSRKVADDADEGDDLSTGSIEADGVPRPIWIDALCINQGDEEEKLCQIRSMNLIYRRAMMVWAWLGLLEDYHLLDGVIELLSTFVEVGWNLGLDDTLAQTEDLNMLIVRNFSPRVWRVLLHLLSNDWCRRVWIVQEFALAREFTFLCGKHATSSALLDELANYAQQLLVFVKDSLIHQALERSNFNTGMFLMRQTVQRGLIKTREMCREQISKVLGKLSCIMSYSFFCLLPQDRVLGMLGMLDAKQYEVLGVDLYAFTDITKLYTKYSTLIMTRDSPSGAVQINWDWLNGTLRQKRRRPTPDLPSWVMDVQQRFILDGFLLDSHLYRASSRLCAAGVIQRAGNLSVRGRFIDTIIVVSADFPFFDDGYSREPICYIELAKWEIQTRAIFRGLRHKDNGPRRTTPWYHDNDECYWRTLVLGRTKHKQGTLTRRTYELFHVALRKLLRNQKKVFSKASPRLLSGPGGSCDVISQAVESLQDNTTDAGRFLATTKLLEGGRLFFTASGNPGFTGPGARIGDIVCVFNGSPTPHVIRRVPGQGRESYKFVGDAYVHGLMNSEVDEMNLQDREFVMV